jgi:hypothetical protein
MQSWLIRLIPSKTLYLLILPLGVLVFLLHNSQPRLSNFILTTPSGKTEAIGAPGFMPSSESGMYRLTGTLSVGKSTNTMLRIIPDDEIHTLIINQRPVDLSKIPLDARRDYIKGFTYDLKEFLQPGDNQIEIHYRDQGGLMGVVISAEINKNTEIFIYLLLTLVALILTLKISQACRLATPVKVLFIGALLIRLAYFSVTPADVRDHDLGDHIAFTEYLTQHWAPPPVEYAIGGAFFHPPLYYYTGAIVYKATQLFEPNNKVFIYRVQQILVLIYSMGFVFFGLLILKELLDFYSRQESSAEGGPEVGHLHESSSPGLWSRICHGFRKNRLFWITGGLFVFWPVGIIHSARIGNDPLLYCLFTASLYYIIRWYRNDRKRDLMIASLIGAAAIITKANGEILIAVLGVIGLYKMIKSRQWAIYIKMAIAPCLIMFIAVAITVGPGLILKLEGKRDKLYIDNIEGLSHANIVGNTASNYFWFDAKIFITEPFTDPYDDRMGRQFFWNYLGKTGLFGEFKYPAPLSINTAVACSFFAVLMFIYILAGIYQMAKYDFKLMAPLLLSGFFLWAGVTYMRMTFPANIDFRYIVPILVTFCALYAVSIIKFEQQGATRMANIGITLSVLFTLCSILFITGIVAY